MAAQTIELTIGKMSCASCAATIERALRESAGVLDAQVNFAAKRAVVKFDGAVLNPSRLTSIVVSAGYEATMIGAGDSARTRYEREIRKEAEEQQTLFRNLAVCFTCLVPLMAIMMGDMLRILWIPESLRAGLHPLRFALVELVLSVPIFVIGMRFFGGGFAKLFRANPDMDTLVAMGTSVAALWSFYTTAMIFFGNSPHAFVHDLYYETACTIITLILLGRYLETRSRSKAADSIRSLLSLQPKKAVLLVEGNPVETPIENVRPGDVMIVKSGERIPTDGVVVKGESHVNESMMTGESSPVKKSPRDRVIGGAVNLNGYLEIRAERVGEETALAQIIRLVESAQASKAPASRFADRVAGFFTWGVMAIAATAAVAWASAAHIYGLDLPGGTVPFVVRIVVAILVVACPCAMGLAAPIAVMVGSGRGAHMGILFKSAAAFEHLSGVDTVVFDKTGTLTQGYPQVTNVSAKKGWDVETVLMIAAIGESRSSHPIASAILHEAKKRSLWTTATAKFENLPGRGINFMYDGKLWFLGNQTLMNDLEISWGELSYEMARFSEEGKTVALLANKDEAVGIIAISDPPKVTSGEAVQTLKQIGLKVLLLTGDSKSTAYTIGRNLGVDKTIAEVLPDQKSGVIEKLQSEGRHVAMVGDGINDAPALSRADVGIAVGAGTDVAIDSAAVVLTKNDPMDVVRAISLARKTFRTIKQNLFWAAGYNALALPIAAGVFYPSIGLLLNPMIAAVAMAFSSLSVVLNALRLKRAPL